MASAFRLAMLASLALAAAPPTAGTAGAEQQRAGQQPAAGAQSSQQPTREGTQEALRERGVEPGSTNRERELRELNQLSRELAPGAPVPAPEIAREGR